MRYPRKTSGAAIMNTITSARSTAMIGSPSVSRKRFRALSGTGMRAPLVQRDHPRGQVREPDLALRELAHHPSAIQDHEAVGYLVHVGGVVLHVDAGGAPRLDSLDERQHLAHLAHRESGRGLIEHDEVGLEVHGARDGDALALAAREIEHGRIGGDAVTAEADGTPQELVGDLLLLFHVDEAEPAGDLSPHEEVSPERLLLAERLPLMHGLDAQVVGLAHRVLVGVLGAVAHPDVPRRRPEEAADDLDEGGLAGAVVAQQADDLVAAHGEVDVRERLHLAERHLHLLEADDVPEALGCGFHGRGLAHARHSSSERIRLSVVWLAESLRRSPASFPETASIRIIIGRASDLNGMSARLLDRSPEHPPVQGAINLPHAGSLSRTAPEQFCHLLRRQSCYRAIRAGP